MEATYPRFCTMLEVALNENCDFDHQDEDIATIISLVDQTNIKKILDDYDQLKKTQESMVCTYQLV